MDPDFITDLLRCYRYRSYWGRWWPTTTSTKLREAIAAIDTALQWLAEMIG